MLKASCAEKQSVLGSKVFHEEEFYRKLCCGSKCSREQNVLSNKVSPMSKVFQRAKCSSAVQTTPDSGILCTNMLVGSTHVVILSPLFV